MGKRTSVIGGYAPGDMPTLPENEMQAVTERSQEENVDFAKTVQQRAVLLKLKEERDRIIAEVRSYLVRGRQYSEMECDRIVFGIELTIEELVMNAWKHGNKYDPTKKIRVDSSIIHGLLQVVVRDQGKGYDHKEVPDCTLPENLEKPSGRGHVLMETFMKPNFHRTKSARRDESEWGMRVEATKRLRKSRHGRPEKQTDGGNQFAAGA